MATLNTLRTKYGIVLSIVIGVVLLAFILGDQLSYRGGDQQITDETVMVVGGKAIKQSEYQQVRNAYEQFQQLSADQVADMSSRVVLYNSYLAPAFEQMGITVTEGDVNNYSYAFTLDVLGQYADYPADYQNAIAQNAWAVESIGAPGTIAAEKFSELYARGVYANRLDIEDQLRKENLTFDGSIVAVPYTSIADSLVTVTDEEVKAYAEAHRTKNNNYRSRTVRYVTFPIEASAEDEAAIIADMVALNETITACAGDVVKIKDAVRLAGGKVGGYKKVETLGDEKEALAAGKNYVPAEPVNNAWVANYFLAKATVPATFDIKTAQFASIEEAKAFVEEVEANGGDITKTTTSADFVDNSIEFDALTQTQADNFINRKEGDIFAFHDNGVPSVVVITKAGEKADFVLSADVNMPIVASEKTIREVTGKVDAFEASMGSGVEEFQNAANAAGYTAAVTVVNRNDYRPNPYYMVERMAGRIANSRSMAVWAYGAEVGETKRFNINGSIYVAIIASVDNEEYTTNLMTARLALLRDKKYEMIAETLTMEAAEKSTFAGIKATDQTVCDIRDSRLINAIASTRTIEQPVKVKGNSAAYIFVVDKINGEDTLPSVETERVPITTQVRNQAKNSAVNTVLVKAGVEDLRDEQSL